MEEKNFDPRNNKAHNGPGSRIVTFFLNTTQYMKADPGYRTQCEHKAENPVQKMLIATTTEHRTTPEY